MNNIVDNEELLSFINICDTYWETFTFDGNTTTQNALENFTSFVHKKYEEENYKTLNYETMSIIISSYRKAVKSTKGKN